jgi:hypothetical protein
MGIPSQFSSVAKPLSIHGHPRPKLYHFGGRLVRIGIIALIVTIGLQIWLAFIWGVFGRLFFGTALFSAVLLLPLLLFTVLHPTISLYPDGLSLKPLLGRTSFLAWSQIGGWARHPLVFNNLASGRLMHGQSYKPRLGVILSVGDGLPVLYRLVGLFAGLGWQPAFALSSTSHRSYQQLVEAIAQALPDNQGEALLSVALDAGLQV